MTRFASTGPRRARGWTARKWVQDAILVVLLSSLLAACGSGAPEIPPELLPDDDDDQPAAGEYPSGPYGTQVGDTLENFTFRGRFLSPPDSAGAIELGPGEAGSSDGMGLGAGGANGSDEAGLSEGELSFADFYDPDGEKGFELLLFNTAAAWCQPCQIEHADLPERVRRHAEEGLVVFSMLFQNASGDPASLDDLDSWVTTFDTNFPMVIDPSYQMGRYGPAETPPLNLIIDPRDMTLVARFVGNQEGPMWARIEAELADRNAE